MIISEQPLFPDNGSEMQVVDFWVETVVSHRMRIVRSDQNSVQLFSEFQPVLLLYSNIHVMLYLQPNDYTTLTFMRHSRFWTSCDHKTRSQFKTKIKESRCFSAQLVLGAHEVIMDPVAEAEHIKSLLHIWFSPSASSVQFPVFTVSLCH